MKRYFDEFEFSLSRKNFSEFRGEGKIGTIFWRDGNKYAVVYHVGKKYFAMQTDSHINACKIMNSLEDSDIKHKDGFILCNCQGESGRLIRLQLTERLPLPEREKVRVFRR